jgi:hypothetical protein
VLHFDQLPKDGLTLWGKARFLGNVHGDGRMEIRSITRETADDGAITMRLDWSYTITFSRKDTVAVVNARNENTVFPISFRTIENSLLIGKGHIAHVIQNHGERDQVLILGYGSLVSAE